jgi:hypothetical protein
MITGADRRVWSGVVAGALVCVLGAVVCMVGWGAAGRRMRLMESLSEQLRAVAVLQARALRSEAELLALRQVAVDAGEEAPRKVVGEALIGEAFVVRPSEETLVDGAWARQELSLTSPSLPASKFLALLPRLCGDEYRYRLSGLKVRAVPGHRGLIELDARFERLVGMAE